MSKLSIHFSNPWLLLLLIPAIALTLLPYFKLSKRYRRTRNRIGSIVLHLTVMLLAITTLAGLTFVYRIPNEKNEVIFVVDVSDTEEQAQINRDDFLLTALEYSQGHYYNIGVVTFGYDQEYAVPLTSDVDKVFDAYLGAELPDTSATNIAAALNYAKELFNYPETGKIVLVTDGKETDEEAKNAIRSVAARGIKVDTAFVPSEYKGDDVQIVNVKLPDRYIKAGEEISIGVTLETKSAKSVTVDLYDNGVMPEGDTGTQTTTLTKKSETLTFAHTFTESGLHELCFKVTTNGDALGQNNEYIAHVYLEVYNKILILESQENTSEPLKKLLNEKAEGEEDPYEIDVLRIQPTATDIPNTVDKLRVYDQVILNNVANADMPTGFSSVLKSYVEEFGGGLFTVGGNDSTGAQHSYMEDDMYGEIYQDLLPVEAIDYTPPLGVVVILDVSGSMASEAGGYKKDEWAMGCAEQVLNNLSERDYMGLMTLDTDYEKILDPTPVTNYQTIRDAIFKMKESNGATVFPGAIERAGQALRALKRVDKRHIIIVTDGKVPSSQKEAYLTLINNFYQTDRITLSVIGAGITEGSAEYDDMKEATDLGHGTVICGTTYAAVANKLEQDLYSPSLKEIPREPFAPTVYNVTSPLLKGIQLATDENGNPTERMTVELESFYGVRARKDATLVLVGNYEVPIYAEWQYGKGKVGSFMCDLAGVWSDEFMADENGKTFVKNVISSLMPRENVRPSSIRVELREDNYTNQLNVYADLKDGEYVKGVMINTDTDETVAVLNEEASGVDKRTADCYITTALGAKNEYSRCDFVVRKKGTYKITLTKYDKNGNELATLDVYKSFSYSEEYDSQVDGTEEELKQSLSDLATRGGGTPIADIYDPWEIYEDFVTELERVYDPRILFMILAITLFLLDIAVRKFKFKWPHELIREYKQKKNERENDR